MDPDDVRRAFETQRSASARGAPDYRRRIDALVALRDGLRAHQADLVAAVSADFGGRPAEETLLLELLPVYDAIRYARRHLRSWMKRRRASPTWFLLPSRAYVVHQPLGVVGVIGAWNYQLLLTLGPVVDALAAGNRVIIKPSELAPRSAELIARIVGERFPADYVTVVTGGPDVAAALTALPLDRLIFTGSTRVGSLVMRAASGHLTPVTLELGGKSPAIIHESYSLERALRRLLVGKLYNAGQTCVAPDYVLVPAGCEMELEQLARRIVAELYPALVQNTDYTRIIDRAHYERLASVLQEAAVRGARVVEINPAAEACTIENRVFAPVLVFNSPRDAAVMRDEIFGPILPVMTYQTLDEAMAFVNERPRPLALYYFDESKTRIDTVVNGTTSGGVLINDVVFHLGQHSIPFGGVGPSGMGHYHGHYGFQTFSKTKGVMVQRRFAPTRFFEPPYRPRVRRLIERLLRISAR